MTKHKDSKHCSCSGCQDASKVDRSNIINVVNLILQHGKKNAEKKTVKEDKLYTAMLDDAGVPMNERS